MELQEAKPAGAARTEPLILERAEPRRPRANPRERRAALAACAFLLPNFLGFLAFTLFPVIFSFWMAFTNWSLKPADEFQYVGLRNFTDLLGVRPLDADHPTLLWTFVVCAAIAFVCVVGAFW